MEDVIAVIPARSGSKGVVNKNIRELAGKPLIAYSIAAARKTDRISRVIVSTDSEQYAEISRSYGAEVPFLRPAEISGDRSGDLEWICHLLEWLQENEGNQPEYLVHLRPTTPLRDPVLINDAIARIKASGEATALRSVHQMTESSYKNFEMENGYLTAVYTGSFDLDASNKPRQLFKDTYEGNGYVDIIKSSFVAKHNKIHGNKVIAFVTPQIGEVDSLEDFMFLEYQATKNRELIQNLFG